MKKKFQNKHILVLGSGPSLKKYWDKISDFISKNDLVTFGCNYITDFLIPDYHFWGSAQRWRKYGHLYNKKSKLIVSEHFPKEIIRERWSGKYLIFKNVERRWKLGSEKPNSKESKRCKVCCRSGKMFGCVRDIATWAIFYAYRHGASKITVVGNDGYTLYSKKELESKSESQHCYGEGYTDGFTYRYCRAKDWDKYRTLKRLRDYGKKKYGFSFEIITPTIYEEFYNPNVLGIEEDHSLQKWVEPKPEEYKKLYNIRAKDRKLKDCKY